MNLGQLEDWISMLLKEKGTELFRYKGVLAVKGFDTKWIFQVRTVRVHSWMRSMRPFSFILPPFHRSWS